MPRSVRDPGSRRATLAGRCCAIVLLGTGASYAASTPLPPPNDVKLAAQDREPDMPAHDPASVVMTTGNAEDARRAALVLGSVPDPRARAGLFVPELQIPAIPRQPLPHPTPLCRQPAPDLWISGDCQRIPFTP